MLLDCNGLDLDPGTFRQCSHLESAAGRAYTGKIGSIDFVHCAEICDVIGQLIVCCSEDCLDISSDWRVWLVMSSPANAPVAGSMGS